MAWSVEAKIWLALKNRMQLFPTSRPVLWPGENTPIPNGVDGYWRVGRVFADPANIFVDDGKKHRRTGFLMVTLVRGLTGTGPVETKDTEAGNLAAWFKDGTSMRFEGVCVKVNNYPYVMDGYEESGYWETPVRIPWLCFA